MAGKFIVIDGIDGSGKETQTKLTTNRLKQLEYKIKTADFPQYGTKSAGLVEEYLNGKYGGPNEVGPYAASIFYAADRYDASFKIKKWLAQGKIIISNRYVAANMAHQGSKITDESEQKKYLKWLYDLEYNIFKIPKPDLNIVLHVDANIAQKLVDEKESRDYINKKKRDIHEDDIQHLKNAEQIYLKIANAFPDFALIECMKNSQIMPREKINDLIWKKIIKII